MSFPSPSLPKHCGAPPRRLQLPAPTMRLLAATAAAAALATAAAAMERAANAAKIATAVTPMSATAKASASRVMKPATTAQTAGSAAPARAAPEAITNASPTVTNWAMIARPTASAAPGHRAAPVESAQPVMAIMAHVTPMETAATRTRAREVCAKTASPKGATAMVITAATAALDIPVRSI